MKRVKMVRGMVVRKRDLIRSKDFWKLLGEYIVDYFSGDKWGKKKKRKHGKYEN